MIRGHSLQEIVDAGIAPSVRWLQDQIRAKKIPAHKIGRHWVLTDSDIEQALDMWASKPVANPDAPFRFTPTPSSLRRRSA